MQSKKLAFFGIQSSGAGGRRGRAVREGAQRGRAAKESDVGAGERVGERAGAVERGWGAGESAGTGKGT